MSIPQRYIPKSLSNADTRKQYKNIMKSRKLYTRGKYYKRPKIKSFKNKKSNHINNAKRIYNIEHFGPTRELSKKTRCSLKTLKKIVNKGKGAYYSNGSRPNQTPESWGVARLASSVTGGKASIVDFNLLEEGCAKDSLALKLARRNNKNIRRTRKFMK
uniref:DUF5824 domain-containing protein n=1 Tax=viral metagenome TaxID=1070528 RepID=A0A6C0DCG0_9ZZZZ